MARKPDPWGPDIIAVLIISVIATRLGLSPMGFLTLVIIGACIHGYIQTRNKRR